MVVNGTISEMSSLALRQSLINRPNSSAFVVDGGVVVRIVEWLQARTFFEVEKSGKPVGNNSVPAQEWLFETDEYYRWVGSESRSTLWVEECDSEKILGIAQAFRQKHLEDDKTIILEFSCTRHAASGTDQSSQFVKEWLAQLLPRCSLLALMLRPLAKTPVQALPDTVLWEYLLEALSSMERVYCIMDSLHEVDESPLRMLLSRLKVLSELKPDAVKVILISRPRHEIDDFLRATSQSNIQVAPDSIQTADDSQAATGPVKTYDRLRSMLDGRALEEFGRSLTPSDSSFASSIFTNGLPKAFSLGTDMLKSRAFRRYGTEMVRAQLIRFLLQRGVHAPGAESSLLHQAFIEVIFEHASRGNVDFEKREQQAGMTVFHATCAMNILEATYLLPGNSHMTPVETWYRATGFFLRLLDFEVDVLAVDAKGRNALHMLLDNPQMSEDHIMTFLNYPEAKLLIAAKDDSGTAPFQYALRRYRPRVCEALLALGADLWEQGPDGSTALHHIAAQWLSLQPESRSGIIPEKKDIAATYLPSLLALWRKFIFLGGSVDARNVKGSSPLFAYLAADGPRLDGQVEKHYSVHVGYFDVFFGAYNAELDIRNNTGQTALHIVAERGSCTMGDEEIEPDAALFSFLVERGLDPLARDIDGKTSLDVAKKRGKKSILRLFKELCQGDGESLD
ncbi:ankyrin repeat-containing domain protein [Xylariaceae sp. FL0016]|nr:ankyrin repeat-containing domain protein [Xylariaceae sp. FL0016]